MSSALEELENYCRICGYKDYGGVSIYSSEGTERKLETKILQYLNIKITASDVLPRKVCYPCCHKLDYIYNFVEHATKVQDALQKLWEEAQKTEKEPENATDDSHNENREDATLSTSSGERKDSENDADKFIFKTEVVDIPVEVNIKSDDENDINDTLNAADSDNEYGEDGEGDQNSEENKDGQKDTNSFSFEEEAAVSKSELRDLPATSKRKKLPRRRRTRHRQQHRSSKKDSSSDEELTIDYSDNDEDTFDKSSDDGDTAEIGYSKKNVSENENEEGLDINDEFVTSIGIKCNICLLLFPSKEQFDNHYTSSHDKGPIYQCCFCNKTYMKYTTFRSHRNRHIHENRYKCDHCFKYFSHQGLLQSHIAAKHNIVKPFICEQCGKGYGSKKGLELHQEKHKPGDRAEWQCEECGKILQTNSGYRSHLTLHKFGKRFMCDLCGRCFHQKGNMQQHRKSHTGEKPFICEKCGKSFAVKLQLHNHYSTHSEERPFQCAVCNKCYKTDGALKEHAKIHLNHRPHICSYCGKGFLNNRTLQQHLNIHTGARPFKCKYCERTFTNYPNYLKHTRRRHENEKFTSMQQRTQLAQEIDSSTSLKPDDANAAAVPVLQSENENENELQQPPMDLNMGLVMGFMYNNFSSMQSNSGSCGMPAT